MYPLVCRGGFPMPAKAGKFSIVGIGASVDVTTAASRLCLVDDEAISEDADIGRILESSDITDIKTVVWDSKGIASVDGKLGEMFVEPVKVRYGLSLYTLNLLANSICVYVR